MFITLCCFFSVILKTVFGKILLKDYCYLDELNTPCAFGCVRSPVCGATKSRFRSLTESERDYILDGHNYYRNQIASGLYQGKSQRPFPPAKNMRVLSYDKECEFFSGCYIRQCLYSNNNIRIALDGNKLGQSMYTKSVELPLDADQFEDLLGEAIEEWICENADIKYEAPNFYYKNKPLIHPRVSNVTYVLWGTNMYVGCAKFHSKRHPKTHDYSVICTYKVPEPISTTFYETGKQKCSIVHERWTALCGHIRPNKEDPFISPIAVAASQTNKFNTGLMLLICIYDVINIVS